MSELRGLTTPRPGGSIRVWGAGFRERVVGPIETNPEGPTVVDVELEPLP